MPDQSLVCIILSPHNLFPSEHEARAHSPTIRVLVVFKSLVSLEEKVMHSLFDPVV